MIKCLKALFNIWIGIKIKKNKFMAHIVSKSKSYIVYLRVLNKKKYVGMASGLGTPEDIAKFRAGGCGIGYKTESENSKFWKAIKKYGWDKVETFILAYGCTFEEARHLESYYIRYYDSFRNGYNENGGEGDADVGEALVYKNGLENNTDNCIRKHKHEYLKKFILHINESDICGRNKICAEAKKYNIPISSLTHYLYRGSDPSGNRVNKEFISRWKNNNYVEKTLCGPLF
jgi:hypothetical protein